MGLPTSRRLLPFLRDDILLVRWPGTDAYQVPLEATPATEIVKGRFEYERRLITDATGQEVLSESTLFLAPGVAVAFRDAVRYGGRDWRVLRVDILRDLRGKEHHLEVALR